MALCLPSTVVAQTHNYSEAFQKALFFYEVQTSGPLPQDHRVEWRGPSATRDGSDVGRDLTGGWYDAGDGVVWTGNEGFGASLLAWSVIKHRDVFIQTGQYRIAVDRLREISDYLEKVVQVDAGGNVARIYCGKGAIRDAPPDDPASDNDRTEGCPNEVMDSTVGGAPQALRPSYWVDVATGGADVAGATAAALASCSIALRSYGETARADALLALAKKVYTWGEANPNLALTLGGTSTSTATRRMVNGSPVTIADYANRSSEWTPRMMYAAAWLHRADMAAATSGYTSAWIDKAEAIYNSAANASKRSKHWVNFATGSEQNGAYAMLAADSGRSVFVIEANSYADFWLYSRSNHSALPGDPTTTPEGFICRGQGAGWNTHALLDQAPPLLDWADSTHNTNATRKSRLIALYTGTYNAGKNECPTKQIDYILGSNTRKLSYLQGYKPAGAGYDWVKNLHHRPTMWAYGGFGTPTADKPEWNTATAYGTLCPGPDKTDFYPVTKKLTDPLEIAYQEPIIYSGGILTVLARNIALGGSSAGSPLPVFPEWEARPSTYQTESFFVRASKDSATRFQCYLNNRARLAPREINTLGFRYYFTPDGVAGSAVSCTAAGSGLLSGESVSVIGPTQVGATGVWYFEIKLNNAMIVPGEYKRHQRKVQLDFSQSSGSFNPANDHSGVAITSTEATIDNLPVYDTAGGAWKLLGGFEPSAGYIQWRRAHFNNVMESATGVTLIAERVGGSAGAASATVTCTPGTATAADFTAPTGSAAVLSWANGESGERTFTVPLTADTFDEGRESFTAILGNITGGALAGIVTEARVSIEDDDFGNAPDPNALVQVLGNNSLIADGDTSPAAADHTDFGSAETGFPASTVTRTFTLRNLSPDNPLQLTGSPAVQLTGAAAGDFTLVSAPPASIAPGESASFQIRFAASLNGTRSANVSIATPQVADGSYTFAIRGTGTGANPVLALSPTAIASAVSPGGTSVAVPVTLQNTGRAGLTWSATLPSNYTAITSTASGGPAYEWIDITTAGANQGTVITSWVGATVGSNNPRDDYLSTTVDLGFNFPYYGSSRAQARISSNGFLTFTTSSTSTSFSNYQMPSTALAATAIAPWWDDLYLKANQGDIYYKRIDADTFVITWHRVSYYNSGSPSGDMSFQVVLKRDGRILCQYKNVTSPVDSTGYTIGIQNSASDPAQAVQYAYNTKTAENGIAIEFRPPCTGSYDPAATAGNWAALSASSGNVSALSSGSFNLTLNTAGLPSGQQYQTAITLTSNDPAYGTVIVPVTLTTTRTYNLAVANTSNRAWETPSNWSPSTAFPGPMDDLNFTTAGGSLRIDGPRTINALTLDASAGLTLIGTGFTGAGTGATLTTTGLVTVQQGALLVGGSAAKLQLNGGLALNAGSLGFSSGATGTITVADSAPVTLSGGILDTLVNTSSTIYRQSLGTGNLTLAGSAPEIKVTEDVFTLSRRLTGSGGFKKTGAGTLLLTGSAADHTGTTEVAAGTLKLGANEVLGGYSTLRLSGGTLATSGQMLSVGTIELAANSTIDFTGGGTLVFADSSAVAWTGATLAITNFDPATCSIRFGNTATGLTPAQIAKINLNGTPFPLTSLNPNGYLDNSAPFWSSGWPKADTATATSFTVRGRINEEGVAYYVVLVASAPPPTAAQVKAGQDSTGATALKSGGISLAANTEGAALVTGLVPNTFYDVYFIAEDVVPSLQSAPAKVSVTTTALSYTWAPDANGNWSDTTKWTPSGTVPNERDITVTFGPLVTAARTITLNTSATLGALIFNEDAVAANSYTVVFNPGQSLTFDVTSGNATLNARGVGGYAIGTQGSGQIVLNDPLAISAGASGSATSDGGTVVLSSQLVGPGSLILSSLNSTDGTGTAVHGARGTTLRSTVANTFSGGVTVNSGFISLVGHIGNLGSGPLTLNASDGSNGGIGSNLGLKTGGGTLTNTVVLGNETATGGGNPRLAISLNDSSAADYIFSGPLNGNLGTQTLRLSTSGNVNSSLTLSGSGNLTSGASGTLQLRSGRLILNNANACTTGNTPGNGTSGGWQLGNFSNGSSGSAQLLANGCNVGGRITGNAATGSGNTSNDNLVLGGVHTSGTATFSGNIQIARIVGGSRQLQLTSASGGTTVFSGAISDGAISGSASTLVPVCKVDNGTVSLSAANSYGGGTTVSAGTLLANNPSGSATGTGAVVVNSGATLGGTGTISGTLTVASGGKLAFQLSTAPASHDKLDVGAVAFSGASSVVITASGSAATTGAFTLLRSAANLAGTVPALTLPLGYTGSLAFSGPELVLTLTQVPLASWAAQAGLIGNNALPSADPDGDGLANLLEYALGTDPSNASERPELPLGTTASGGGNYLTLTFTPQRSDVTYSVDAGSDLASWTALPMPVLTVGQSATVTDTVAIESANPPCRFLRLKVAGP